MFFLRRLNPKRTAIISMLIITFALNCCIFWAIRNNVFGISDEGQEVLTFKKYGRKYCVSHNYWEASHEYYYGNHTTLVLHSTVDYLPYLKEQAETWDGGISFALYIPIYNDSFISDAVSETILKLQLLKKELNSTKISLHLFFQATMQRNCLQKIIINKEKLRYELPESRYTYPINVARNIGRNGIGTEFFISGDIEQIYVKNFESRMLKLANEVLMTNQTRTVLVHRRFEIERNVSIPQNKRELKELYQQKLAIPFHQHLYSLGHYIPKLQNWFETNDTKDLTITQTLDYGNIAWEPQFVADSRIPFHDERFPYRYRSNAHLSNLLCMHNFTFSIVSDVFSVHRGITEELPPTKLEIFNRQLKFGIERMNKKFFRELQKMSQNRYNFCFNNRLNN